MSQYRKCLSCKEVKDKDEHFTIESWKCNVCVKTTGPSKPGGAAATPRTDAPSKPAATPAQNAWNSPAPPQPPAAAAAAPPPPAAPAPAAVPPVSGWGQPSAKPPTDAPPKTAAGWGEPPASLKVPSTNSPRAASGPGVSPRADPAFVPPTCSQCGGPILGPALDAMQGKWHPDCFLCCICNEPIKEVDFAIVDGKQAHEACRPKPLCCKCETPIGGMILTALDQKWHETCFRCIRCEAPLAHQKFFIEEDDDGNEVPLCEGCTPKPEPCHNCGQPVDRGIVALDATWHPQCFVCGACGKPLDGPFFPKGKTPYCSKQCYLTG